MTWPTLPKKCPFCGGILRDTDVDPPRPLPCRSCGALLQHSEGQLWQSVLVALCISLGVAYLLNVKGVGFVVATAILWFAVLIVWHFIYVRIVPPRYEAYAGKHYEGLFNKQK